MTTTEAIIFDQLVNLNECAEILHIHHQSARRLIRAGKGPEPIMVLGRYYFKREDVEEFAKTYTGRPGRKVGRANGPKSDKAQPINHQLHVGLTDRQHEAVAQIYASDESYISMSEVGRALVQEALEARGLLDASE